MVSTDELSLLVVEEQSLYLIITIHHSNLDSVLEGLLSGHHGIEHDYDQIAGLPKSGGSPVEAEMTLAIAGYRIRCETGAVVDVEDITLFALIDIQRLHQVSGNGYGPDVVQVGLGEGRSMDLGPAKDSIHLITSSYLRL